MLIISSNLVLTADEEALPDGTPMILWDNLVTVDNVAASSEDPDYPITNVANPATNQEWRAAGPNSPPDSPTPDIEITITTNTSEFIDGVGIARHNFGTEGITVEVGYYDTNSPPQWVSLAGPQIPANDEPLMFQFTPQPLTTVVIKMSGSDSPRAAVIYCGKLLIMERGVVVDQDYAIPRFARHTEFYNGGSERGDYLGRIVTSQFIAGVEHVYANMHPDWYRTEMDPFVSSAQQDVPFFYCFAPDDYPLEVAFAWFTDDPIAMTNPVTRRMRLVLKMDGIVE